jgi:hypothetical protein
MLNQKLRTVRRSVALPRELVDDVLSVVPPELKGNLNRLVLVSLRDFVARRRAEAFEQRMAEMGTDPAIRSECAAISEEFTQTERDGLGHD